MRRKPVECEVDEKLQLFYGSHCRSQDPEGVPFGKQDHTCFRPSADSDGIFNCYFDIERPLDIVGGPLDTIEHNLIPYSWIGGTTDYVEVQIGMFNAEVRLYALTKIRFTFDVAGTVSKDVTVDAISANIYPNFSYLLFDIVFLGLIGILLNQEGYQVIRCRAQGHLREYFCDFWNVLDWFTILIGLVLGLF